MLLRGSIEPDSHNRAIKNARSVRINSYNFFALVWLHALNGSIESDNHKGVIENFEKRSDK